MQIGFDARLQESHTGTDQRKVSSVSQVLITASLRLPIDRYAVLPE